MKKIIISTLSLFMFFIPVSRCKINNEKITSRSEVTCNAYDTQNDFKRINSEYVKQTRADRKSAQEEERKEQEEAKKQENIKKQEASKKQEEAKKQQEAKKQNDEQQQTVSISSASVQDAQNGGYIDAFNISSISKYLIYVNLSRQMVYVLTGSKSNWKLTYNFQCSSGVGPYPEGGGTPTGEFTVKSRGKWFFADKYKEGAEYWTQFYGNYLFHSLPMDRNHNVVDATLGKPASHGCIRLAIDNAKWIYNNIPTGTKVYIK